MRYDTGRPEDSDTASVRNTDALTHRRSPTRACLLSTRAVDARARVEVARVRATSLLRDGNARLLASGNAKTPASLRLPEFRRRVGRTARDFFFTRRDPGRLVNAESGTMVTLVRLPAPTTGGRLPPRATQRAGRAPREVVSSTASRQCQPPDPVFEVAQGSVLGFAGFSGSVPNAALIALCRRSLSL